MFWNFLFPRLPAYYVRDMERSDLDACRAIVELNWGSEIAAQAYDEMEEMFISVQKWPPHYFVVTDADNRVVGFAGYKAAWLMSRTYELIWINIHPDHQSKGLGKMLTDHRLEEIERLDGSLVLLMTQKPSYFEQFGFEPIRNIDGWMLMTKQLKTLTLSVRNSK